MSGIVGIINLDSSPVDRNLLGRMTDFLAFRGLDAKGTWIDRNVGFGHTMLRTTFEAETETQPLTLDGKVWLTADARIDGRSELIAKLETKLQRKLLVNGRGNGGASTITANDAELILYSYEAWEEECARHLIGDFAFAIWDSRKRRLFCARDHFGVKQFYYAQVGSTLVFSNTLNCVRLHPVVSDELDDAAIGDYLLFGLNQDLTSTTFRDIRRLPPATHLTGSTSITSTRRYWTFPANGQIKFSNTADYVDRFNELFVTAVSDRLRTNKVSVSMSGGLDSTSVAAVARDLLRHQFGKAELRSYVVVYDKLISDEERRFSTLTADALQIPITHIAADDYLLYEETVVKQLHPPEPFLMNPTSAQFRKLLGSMAEHSRVALSGWDGDALMNEPPNAHFAGLAKRLRVKKLLADMGWFVWSRHQLPPIGLRTRLKRLIGTHPANTDYPEWIDESFSRRANLRERWRKFTTETVNAHPTRPYAMSSLNSTVWGPLFEEYDSGASCLAIEIRHPIMDVRLVDYLLSIPPVPWCVNKEILRAAMSAKLPSTVLNRPKTPLADHPALYLVDESKVRFVDNFEPAPSLREFVNLTARPRVAGERNADRLWTNLRPFGLNYWLLHFLFLDQPRKEETWN